MRIIFFGTPPYTIEYLEDMAADHELCAVVSVPDKQSGRGRRPKSPAPVIWGQEKAIPVHQPSDLDSPDFQQELSDYHADLGFVIAYGRIIPDSVFNIPALGCFNLHFSLLPEFRGASPVESTLLCGKNSTGVTVQKITESLDAGDILAASEVAIKPADHYPELLAKLHTAGRNLVKNALKQLASGTFSLRPQAEDGISTCRKIERKARRLDWTEPAFEICNRIRAFSGRRTAYCFYNDKRILIHRAGLAEQEQQDISASPGIVLSVDNHELVIACGQGALKLLEVQPENSKKMSVQAFLNGHKIKEGSLFE